MALQTACPQGWFLSVFTLFSVFWRFYPWGSDQAGLSPMCSVPQTGQESG